MFVGLRNGFMGVRLLACLLVEICFLVANGTSNTATKPNVLMIIADDLRSQLGGVQGVDDAQGFMKTPHLSSLAKNGGTVFSHTFAQESLCGPSRNRSCPITQLHPILRFS